VLLSLRSSSMRMTQRKAATAVPRGGRFKTRCYGRMAAICLLGAGIAGRIKPRLRVPL
jgi:hypothetical protein